MEAKREVAGLERGQGEGRAPWYAVFLTARARTVLMCLALCAAAFFAYHNTFNSPFIFDGRLLIRNDPSIRQLWPLGDLLRGTSRPLVKLTFALNYLFGELNLFHYHLVNIIIHMSAGLTLFGLIRRTILAPKLQLSRRYPADAIAFAAALLWTVHPLQTESVTYIYQRSESLMGLFYLLTLYALSRGLGSGRGALKWFLASVLFCLAGMSSKLVMVTAPLMALAYDWIFWASSWRQIRRERLWFYCCLALSWALFLFIALRPNESRGTAGLGIAFASPLQYASVQPGAVMHYLKLAFWPYGLALDSGWPFAWRISSGIGPLAAVAAMLLAAVWALWRRPALGFLGLWFFLALAPSSSFFPLADPVFEHRMYLSLAAVTLAAVLLAWFAAGKLVKDKTFRYCLLVFLLVFSAGFLSVRSVQRNQRYSSRYSIWKDTVAKRPDNPRGHVMLARVLRQRGAVEEAVAQYKEALRCRQFGPVESDLGPADIYYNSAIDFARIGDMNRAIASYHQALKLDPRSPQARNNLAVTLARNDDFHGAFQQLSAALALDGANGQIRTNMDDLRECIILKLGRSERLEDFLLVMQASSYK